MRTAWVRDAQDAQTKRRGLLAQYQELKDQRQLIVTAGPDGDLSNLRPPAWGPNIRRCSSCLIRQIEQVVANGNFYKQRIEQLQRSRRSSTAVERRRGALERELSQATSASWDDSTHSRRK